MRKIRDKAASAKASKGTAKKVARRAPAALPAKSTRPAATKPHPRAVPKKPLKVAPQVAKTRQPVATPAPAPAPVVVIAPAVPPLVEHLQDLAPGPKATPHGALLTVSIQSSQGMAANGNLQPANLLVVVTCAGWPVTELTKDHFTLMQHFEVPGQTAPFSNNITSFRNAGTGAYLLQIKPINATPWCSGHHLGQLLISTPEDQQGQAAFKLIIR